MLRHKLVSSVLVKGILSTLDPHWGNCEAGREIEGCPRACVTLDARSRVERVTFEGCTRACLIFKTLFYLENNHLRYQDIVRWPRAVNTYHLQLSEFENSTWFRNNRRNREFGRKSRNSVTLDACSSSMRVERVILAEPGNEGWTRDLMARGLNVWLLFG